MIQAMKAAGFRPAIWIPIVCVLLGSTLAWAGWNSLATANALPKKTFNEHVVEQRDRIEDKLDEIQKTILDLHK